MPLLLSVSLFSFLFLSFFLFFPPFFVYSLSLSFSFVLIALQWRDCVCSAFRNFTKLWKFICQVIRMFPKQSIALITIATLANGCPSITRNTEYTLVVPCIVCHTYFALTLSNFKTRSIPIPCSKFGSFVMQFVTCCVVEWQPSLGPSLVRQQVMCRVFVTQWRFLTWRQGGTTGWEERAAWWTCILTPPHCPRWVAMEIPHIETRWDYRLRRESCQGQ